MANTISENTPLLVQSDVDESNVNKIEAYGKLMRFLSAITVEPALFLYAFCYGLESVFTTNLWIDKICKESYSPEVCRDLDSGKYPQQQDDVQRRVNDFDVYIHVIQYLPGTFLVLLLGAWSDMRDRKTPILVSLSGLLLKGLLLTANCYWWNLPSFFMLVAYAPVGLTGTVIGFYGAAYAYVSVICGGRSRTTRVALVSIIVNVFSPCGQALAEILFEHGGYVAVFGMYALLVAVSFLYCLLRLDELSVEARENAGTRSVCQVLSITNLKNTILVAFRPRVNGVRGFIVGHVSVVGLYMFSKESKLFHFLFCRKKFAWGYDKFTRWFITDLSLSASGQSLLLPILSYFFQIEDAMLGFAGTVSSFFSFILRATASNGCVFYISSAVGLCSEIVTASSRAALSKLVEREELGAIFGILAMSETIIPTVAPFIYTAIYNSTLEVFPGTIFVVSAISAMIILFILTWILTREIKENEIKENQSKSEDPKK